MSTVMMVMCGAGAAGGCRVPQLVVLCVCVCVWGVNSYRLTVLINRIQVLPTWADTSIYEYRYEAGDTVDVMCITYDVSCYLTVSYDRLEQRLGGHGTERRSVGVRSTLGAAHNRSHVTCQLRCNDINLATVKVTFVLQNKHNDSKLKLKVNDLTYKSQDTNYIQLYYNYYYLSNERIKFACDTSDQFYVEGITYMEYIQTNSWSECSTCIYNRTTVLVTPGSSDFLLCKIINKTKPDSANDIRINMFELPAECTDDKALSVSASEQHDGSGYVTTLLYQCGGDQLVVYEYTEGESVTLNCTTLAPVSTDGYYIQFGGTVSWSNNSVIRTFGSELGNNTILECSLTYYNKVTKQTAYNIRRLRVLFRQTASLRPPGMATTEKGFPLWSLAVVVPACLITAAAALCYLKKRAHSVQLQGASGVENNSEDITSRPHVPQLESQNVVASSNSEERRRRPEPATAHGTRPDDTPELLYAELDMSHHVNILSYSPRREETPYAEVVYKNPRTSSFT